MGGIARGGCNIDAFTALTSAARAGERAHRMRLRVASDAGARARG